MCPGAKPNPSAEGREEPHPAGADAPGGGGAPLRGTGTRGHAQQRLHANLPLQAAIFYLLVARYERDEGVTVAIEETKDRELLLGFLFSFFVALERNGSHILGSACWSILLDLLLLSFQLWFVVKESF